MKRRKLEAVIGKIEPPPSGQLGLDGQPAPAPELTVAQLTAWVDLGIKLERSLAGEVDEAPDPDAAPPTDATVPPKSTRRARF